MPNQDNVPAYVKKFREAALDLAGKGSWFTKDAIVVAAGFERTAASWGIQGGDGYWKECGKELRRLVKDGQLKTNGLARGETRYAAGDAYRK